MDLEIEEETVLFPAYKRITLIAYLSLTGKCKTLIILAEDAGRNIF